MGLMMRRRRPVARLAVGAATAGVAYHAGKRRVEQDQYNQQASAAYAATDQSGAPPQQYVPPPPAPAAPSSSDDFDELTRLAKLHDSGVLTDEEFSAAKAKVLDL